MPEVTMPRLSDSMEEGTITNWLKADGEHVNRGEEIVEIETDKATMAYEADFSGPLTILVQAGASVALGDVIAAIGERAEAPARPSQTATTVTPPRPTAVVPATEGSARATIATAGDGRTAVKASPLARRVALNLGVELSTLTGSGPYGRILKSDVTAAADARPRVAVQTGSADGQTQQLTRTQALIARRMSQSRAEVPEFALQVDVDMAAAIKLRNDLKEAAESPPSINDVIVMASARALRQHARVNGSFQADAFVLHDQVNVAIAVATDDSLVAPVLRGADRLSLGGIAAESRRLIERVRSGTITPAELDGGTFTVSNLGMYGIDRFEGIINAPQAAILCVGAVRERPVAHDGQVVVRPTATLTLACDHRILYGADAARFLADLRVLLEQPLLMLL